MPKSLFNARLQLMQDVCQFLTEFFLPSEYKRLLIKDISILLRQLNQSKLSMTQKGKPFMIESYAQDNSLLNKYKFVLVAKTVTELRAKIIEKLQGKNHITKDDKITMKDTDDFELGSDDEVDDVLPDCKLRIYITKPAAHNPAPEKKDKQEPSQSVPAVLSQPAQNNSSPNTQPVASLGSKVVVDVPIIEWTSPQVDTSLPQDKVWRVICPQIRKTQFELEAVENVTFYELSKYIIKKFNIDEKYKALVYTAEGQPLLFNLDLLHFSVPQLNYKNVYYIVFTATASPSADLVPAEPTEIKNDPVDLKVSKGEDKLNINIDLANSVSVLKYKIFKKIGVPVQNQIIKFGPNALVNDSEVLSACNIKSDSILTLEFKVISNIIPASYADKFYYKDVQLLHPQDQQAYRAFKSNILAFGYHTQDGDHDRMLSFLRGYTCNEPLVCALRTLFKGDALLSQAHRIALEEGFYAAMWFYAKSCNPQPHTQAQFLFNHIRHFIGFLFQAIKNTNHTDAEFVVREKSLLLSRVCQLTTKQIKVPSLIKLDDGNVVLVDRDQLSEQISKGYAFPLLKTPTKQSIYQNQSLLQNWQILTSNLDMSPTSFSIMMWQGFNEKDLTFNVPAIDVVEKYEPAIVAKCPNLKIFGPLEVKNSAAIYLVLLNKEQEHRVFVSRNKDINRPHNIFDVITGQQVAVNLDLMMAAGKTENLEEVVDIKDLKPVITRDPKQAIVVLFDISGSMGGKFFNEPDLVRIGACKLFFEALAYRTIAYSFQHVISLAFFDDKIQVQCDFTEAFYDFNRLVAAAKPRGGTKLYDAIVNGVSQLVEFKKRYPECILRILALTDGEDTSSKYSIFEATKAVITNNIIMDSFAVGANCEGLKTITIASGGKCYLTRNMDESLKLFEQETVLSVRTRKTEQISIGKTDIEIYHCIQKAKLRPFDLGNDVHQFKMPEIKGPGLNAAEFSKKYNTQEGQKKLSGNNSLRRIAKQIEKYNQNPHPFVAIYPCENINMWKILLLGPKQTPYENGLFLLYASFPGDYPFRAPQVRFITRIYHCNMNQQGRICHSVFDRNYSPAINFRQIVDSVYGLILTPEPDDPLDNVVATFFLSDYPTYVKNAKEATLKNASKTPEELVEELFGRISDDIERQKRVEEITQWIQKAKSFN